MFSTSFMLFALIKIFGLLLSHSIYRSISEFENILYPYLTLNVSNIIA